MPRKKTTESFAKEALAAGAIILEEYTGNKQKILVSCVDCGHIWRSRVDHVLDRKCPECSLKVRMKPAREYVRELMDKDIVALETYKGRNVSIMLRCLKCGREWSAMPSSGQRCYCSSKALCGEPVIAKDRGDYSEVLVCGKEIMLIDNDDLHKINRQISLDKNGYPRIRINGRDVFVHRLIMQEDRMVDHIDRDPLNNRKKNLRYATKSQNAMNSRCRKDSKTGIRGVAYDSRRMVWRSSICKNGKVMHLGSFENVDIAIGARLQAERELFGEFAPTGTVHI